MSRIVSKRRYLFCFLALAILVVLTNFGIYSLIVSKKAEVEVYDDTKFQVSENWRSFPDSSSLNRMRIGTQESGDKALLNFRIFQEDNYYLWIRFRGGGALGKARAAIDNSKIVSINQGGEDKSVWAYIGGFKLTEGEHRFSLWKPGDFQNENIWISLDSVLITPDGFFIPRNESKMPTGYIITRDILFRNLTWNTILFILFGFFLLPVKDFRFKYLYLFLAVIIFGAVLLTFYFKIHSFSYAEIQKNNLLDNSNFYSSPEWKRFGDASSINGERIGTQSYDKPAVVEDVEITPGIYNLWIRYRSGSALGRCNVKVNRERPVTINQRSDKDRHVWQKIGRFTIKENRLRINISKPIQETSEESWIGLDGIMFTTDLHYIPQDESKNRFDLNAVPMEMKITNDICNLFRYYSKSWMLFLLFLLSTYLLHYGKKIISFFRAIDYKNIFYYNLDSTSIVSAILFLLATGAFVSLDNGRMARHCANIAFSLLLFAFVIRLINEIKKRKEK